MRLLFLLLIIFICSYSLNAEWINYNLENSDLISDEITTVEFDAGQYLWVGTPQGLFCIKDHQFLYSSTENLWLSNQINDIKTNKRDEYTDVWAATDSGVALLKKSAVQESFDIELIEIFTQENSSLISNQVNCISIDSNGIVYFGTDDGISAYDGSNWRNFLFPDELNFPLISAIESDLSGEWKYICTLGGGVNRLQGTEIDAISGASAYDAIWSGMLSDSVTSGLVDSDTSQWFGTNLGISHHYSIKTKRNWNIFDRDSGLADNFINTIEMDSSGKVWVGTPAGLCSYDGENWQSFVQTISIEINSINDIAIEPNGSVWCATQDGLSCLNYGVTDISETGSTFESLFKFTVYPNPFNKFLNIVFYLQKSSEVKLEFFNLFGQMIDSQEVFLNTGLQKIVWDSKKVNISSGVYFIKLTLNHQILTKKITLIK